MAFPTVHWSRFTGTLTIGQRVTITHGLQNGLFANIAPNAVHFDMSTGVYTEPPNVSIGEYQARTTQYVYLSNYDPAATHYYGVVCREYHSIDDANQ